MTSLQKNSIIIYVDTPSQQEMELNSHSLHPLESEPDTVTCFQRIQHGKGKTNSNFTVEKPGKYYLGQVMDVIINSNVTWILCSPYDVTGRTLHLCDIRAKN